MALHIARRTVAVVCTASAVAASLLIGGGLRGEAGSEQVICTATGNIDDATASGGGYDWSITGAGSCTNPIGATMPITFFGTGSSSSNGVCDNTNTVNDLSIMTIISFTKPGGIVNARETIGLPMTLATETIPFQVTDGESGAGSIFTRLFDKCSPTGMDTAAFYWTQTAP
jgi:hypothetical protein